MLQESLGAELPLCLAKYRPKTMRRHNMAKTTTATTPPITAWSNLCASGPACESDRRKSRDDVLLATEATNNKHNTIKPVYTV